MSPDVYSEDFMSITRNSNIVTNKIVMKTSLIIFRCPVKVTNFLGLIIGIIYPCSVWEGCCVTQKFRVLHTMRNFASIIELGYFNENSLWFYVNYVKGLPLSLNVLTSMEEKTWIESFLWIGRVKKFFPFILVFLFYFDRFDKL